MNPTTKTLLRNAILEALSTEQDVAAMELMTLLTGTSPAPGAAAQPPLALPPSRQLIDGPAHDYHYWTGFIRENFIPFMTANGRLRFTSHELMSWLENCNELKLTTGDIESHSTGRETWRNGVSAALSALKQRGIVKAPAFGKDYLIQHCALAEASR